MRTHRHGFLVAAALLGLAVFAPTQGAVPAAVDGLDVALSGWEQVGATDGRARGEALTKLAGFDDPRVTLILLAELERAGADPFAVRVLEAIGLRPRGEVLGPLRAVLLRDRIPLPMRNAAATAIARQGNRGIDLLLDHVRTERDGVADDVRVASANGLAAVGDERAWRGLAPLVLRGPLPERLAVLRLLEPARGVAAVTQARIRVLQDSDALMAATAWRQLAAEGHPRSRAAFEDLVERLGPAPVPAACAQLILGLGEGMPRDAWPVFLRLAASEQPAVQAAVRAVARVLAVDAPFVRWLIDEAVDSKVPQERRVALAIVGKAPAATLQPLLDKVRAGLAHPTAESLDLALALTEVLARDARWPDDVRRLLGAGDPALRTAGFALLFDLGIGDAIEQAQRNTTAKEWELRSVAYRYLTRFRAVSSIPILIARVEKEEGRLDVELGNALFALTGTRCWRRTEWDAWWRKNRDTHQLPAVETISAASGQGAGSTVAYYGIPLSSKRTIFLLDVSGSMLQKIGTDRKRTRLSEAKRQLRSVVERLPDDQLFNVMAYEGGVTPVWDAMHKAAPAEKQIVLELIDKVAAGRGGTNIHDALELAFRDPQVDTIYLLTDGEPTVGKLVVVDEIADQVRRWNYQRQVVVHGIALGTDSRLLQRLAEESGGQYVLAR